MSFNLIPAPYLVGVIGSGVPAPVNSVLPSISSSAVTEGATATVTPGTWSNSPVLTYQWTRDNVDISGATGTAYAYASADVGKTIRVKEIPNGDAGLAATSNGLGPIVQGVLMAIGLRGSAAFVTDVAPWDHWVTADGTAPITRNGCTFDIDNLTAPSDQNSGYPFMVAGYSTINSNAKFVKCQSVPAGTTAKVRLAIGRVTISETNLGFSVWDGDPGAGGVKRLETTIASIATGSVADATGATMAIANWPSVNQAVDILCNSGSIWIGYNFTTTNPCYLRAAQVHYPSYGVETSGVGPYFVNYAAGDNTKDGKSVANAWKNLPGDPDAVGGTVKDFVLLPGAVVNIEGGQIHKPAGFGSRSQFVFLRNSGSVASPIVYQPRTGTGSPIFEASEDLAFTTAATSGDVSGNASWASITYQTFGSAVNWSQAPVEGGKMLRPACFPKPGDISAYDNSDSGNDSFVDEGLVTGPGGSSPLWTQAGSVATYSGTAILNHYGSVDITGYQIVLRVVGNLMNHYTVASHNTATGQITVSMGSDTLFPSTTTAHFMWQIRYHPFDLLAAGQYAYSADRLKVFGWFSSGTRGFCRLTLGVAVDHDYVEFRQNGADRITWRNFSGGSSVRIVDDAGFHPVGFKFSGIIRNMADTGRDYAVRLSGLGTGHDLSDIDIADSFPKGGVVMIVRQSTMRRLKVRETGRTNAYAAGVYSTNGNSQDLTWSDFDCCDEVAIHGNGASMYQDAQRVALSQVLMLNHVRPLTNQGYTGSGQTPGLSKANSITNAALTARRQIPGAPTAPSLLVLTQDNEGTDTVWDGLWIENGTGMNIGSGCTGMEVKNSYIGQLGAGSGLSGVKFTNCVVNTSNGGTYTTLAQMIAAGADAASTVTFTSETMDGTISALARGALAASASRNIGTTQRPWTIPQVGTTFTLADISLTTIAVHAGHLANLPFGQTFGHKPGSSLSLPAAVDNALFGLWNGQVYFQAAAVAGVYTLRVRETNVSADNSGAATHDTDFTITVA